MAVVVATAHREAMVRRAVMATAMAPVRAGVRRRRAIIRLRRLRAGGDRKSDGQPSLFFRPRHQAFGAEQAHDEGWYLPAQPCGGNLRPAIEFNACVPERDLAGQQDMGNPGS